MLIQEAVTHLHGCMMWQPHPWALGYSSVMPTCKVMNNFLRARLSAHDSYMLYQLAQIVHTCCINQCRRFTNAVPATKVKCYGTIGDCGRKSDAERIINPATNHS